MFQSIVDLGIPIIIIIHHTSLISTSRNIQNSWLWFLISVASKKETYRGLSWLRLGRRYLQNSWWSSSFGYGSIPMKIPFGMGVIHIHFNPAMTWCEQKRGTIGFDTLPFFPRFWRTIHLRWNHVESPMFGLVKNPTKMLGSSSAFWWLNAKSPFWLVIEKHHSW